MTTSMFSRNSSGSTNTNDLIDARTVTNSHVNGNAARTIGRVVRLDSRTTGNRVTDNNGLLTSGAANYLDHVH